MANTSIPKNKAALGARYILETADPDLINATALDTLTPQAPVAADVFMFQEGGLGGDLYAATAQQIANLYQPWTAVAVNTNMTADNAYITTANANMLLPATAALGTRVRLLNTAGNFTITQGAGQSVVFYTTTTTVGAGGSIATTAAGQSLELVCTTADTVWHVVGQIGAAFTIV